MTQPPAESPWLRRLRFTPLTGTLAGFLLGMNDYLLLRLFGVDMRVGDLDVTLLVVTLFALNFAAVGYIIGRLLETRDQLRESAAVIQQQLQALHAGQQRLLQAEKLAAIGQLAAGVAHEVRNPLGIIRASASMLLEDLAPDSDAHRAGQFIRDEVDRLNAVVTGLLNFARPLAPGFTEVDLRETVEAARYRLEEELKRRNIRLELRAAPGLPPAHGDPDLLTQVLFGLLLNAAQAIDAEGRIEVRLDPAPPTSHPEDTAHTSRDGTAPAALQIDVADDGPGVPPDAAPRLFEPFFTTRAGGTGLGLPMAARIAEALGGTLEHLPGHGAGPDGAGACFRLTLQTARSTGPGVAP